MKKYKYTAVNLKHEEVSGIFIAKNEKDLAVQLAKQDLYLVSVSPYSGQTPSSFFTLGTGAVKLTEITTFCRQFAIMINAGIPLIGCLESLKDQAYSSYFRKILQVIFEDVKSGLMLSEALEKHKKVFPEFFRNMILVGETSGKLELVFNSLADYYERDAALKRRTKSALIYPIMLVFLTIGIIALMLGFVVPAFRSSLVQLNIKPEGLTKVVYDISDFLTANWTILLLVVIVIALGIFVFGRTEKGKYVGDTLKLKLPLIRKVSINMLTAKFARSFGLLLSSGMDVVDALDVMYNVLGNRYLRVRFRKASDDVKQGTPLAMAFERYKVFPPMLLQMISVGEKTASIDEVLIRSCNYFDSEVESSLMALTSVIQPIMLAIMGTVVAILFLAIYSPMLSIMTQLV